ncbi:MAG: FHA domain-containing protein [Planctomycetes bacterium]|nr:FHA domain-containing protein [Planctomycetota bacterium]
MASLLIISGPQEGDYYPIGQRTTVVGRDEHCPIQIVDDTVSRWHLEIRWEQDEDHFAIRDMKSANGVFLNDCRLDERGVLSDGDVIRLGASELMFSELDFTNRDAMMDRYRQRGEHDRSTVSIKRG